MKMPRRRTFLERGRGGKPVLAGFGRIYCYSGLNCPHEIVDKLLFFPVFNDQKTGFSIDNA